MKENEEPPFLAQALLARTAHPDDRPFLLGDLQEEYLERCAVSAASARGWYWRQVLASLPHLMLRRLRARGAVSAVMIAALTIAAVSVITLWETQIARMIAMRIATSPEAPDLVVIRSLYFLIYMAGIALAGGGVAALAFNPVKSFAGNAARYLAPVFALLLAVFAAQQIVADRPILWAYLALRMGLTAPALLLGAFVSGRVFTRQP